jgi:PE family
MSFLSVSPDFVARAASDVAGIGSAVGAANSAAAPPTAGLLAAGADEASAAIATVFAQHAQAYQTLSAQAEAFHSQFVLLMNAGAAQYAAAEAANANPLQMLQQQLLDLINMPTSQLLGRRAADRQRRHGRGGHRRPSRRG